MDGLWQLNNEYHLKSVAIVLHGNDDLKAEPDTVLIQNLRLAGPKGDIMLAKFDEMPGHLMGTREKYVDGLFTDKTELKDTSLKDIAQITNEGKNRTKALRVKVEPGIRLNITVGGFDVKFNLNDEYTRISYDCKAISRSPYLRRYGWRYLRVSYPMLIGNMILNSASVVPVHQIQGGILVEYSLKAENKHDDSFGQFTYRNYFAAHSKWTRQTILTAEGILVVRDVYLAGKDADGYSVGPNWILSAEGEFDSDNAHKPYPPTHDGKQNWFDAPGYDHAWWQSNPKRMTLYIHPEENRTYGQMQHKSSPDIHHYCNSSYVKANAKAGKLEVFLSVLVPHDKSEKGEDVVKRIKTNVDKDGNATATIGKVKVTIDIDGEWNVTR